MADGSRLCSVLGAFDGSLIAASNTATYSASIHGDGQVKRRINAININRAANRTAWCSDGSAAGSFTAARNTLLYSACVHGDGQVKIRM